MTFPGLFLLLNNHVPGAMIPYAGPMIAAPAAGQTGPTSSMASSPLVNKRLSGSISAFACGKQNVRQTVHVYTSRSRGDAQPALGRLWNGWPLHRTRLSVVSCPVGEMLMKQRKSAIAVDLIHPSYAAVGSIVDVAHIPVDMRRIDHLAVTQAGIDQYGDVAQVEKSLMW